MNANNTTLSSDSIPHSISSILTKDFDSLTLPQKEDLAEFVRTEEEATASLSTLASTLKDISSEGADILDESLEKTDIPPQDKNQVKKIYSQTILQTIENVTSSIFEYLKQGKEVLNIPFLAEKLLNVIEGFQAFKAKLDQHLPVSCDTILKKAVPVLLFITDAVAPGISTVLRASTILEKATDFLQDENLNKIKEKLKAVIERSSKEPGLDSVVKATELSDMVDVPPSTLGKVLGTDPKAMDETIKEVSQKPGLIDLVQNLGYYAEMVLPKNQKDIAKIKETIKSAAIKPLERFGLPKEVTKIIEQQLDKGLSKIEKVLSEQIISNKPLIEKIASIQKISGEVLFSTINEATKIIKTNIPEAQKAKEVRDSFANGLKSGIKKCLSGNIKDMATKLQDPKIKNFAKTILKAGHAALLDIERMAGKAGPSRER